MRKLLLIPLLALLSGCVSYYYPVTDATDGVYYASDDIAYYDYYDDSASFASVQYYPWWSMDYFYLGSGYFGSGYSIGIGYQPYSSLYSSWYDPWYGSWYYPSRYYRPFQFSGWYAPTHYYYSWFGFPYHNPYWHTRYRSYHHDQHRGYDHDRHRYVRRHTRYQDRWNDPNPGLNPPRDYETAVRGTNRRATPGPATRRVSVAPSTGAESDRGMVVRSRDNAKRTRNRTEPVKSDGNSAITVRPKIRPKPDDGDTRQPDRRYSNTRRQTEQVRYRSNPKPGTSRTSPVAIQDSAPSVSSRSTGNERAENRRVTAAESRRGNLAVRSAPERKARPSKLQPTHRPEDRTAPGVHMPAPPARQAPSPNRSPALAMPPQRSTPAASTQRPAKPSRAFSKRSKVRPERSDDGGNNRY